MRRPLLLAILLLVAGKAAQADTITANFTVGFINLQGTDGNLFGVSQFNPAPGTLNSSHRYALTGNVVFVPDSPGDSFYQLTLDGFSSGPIFRQNTMPRL